METDKNNEEFIWLQNHIKYLKLEIYRSKVAIKVYKDSIVSAKKRIEEIKNNN